MPWLLLLVAASPTSSPVQSGDVETRLSARSPESAIKEQLRRFGWRWEQIHSAKDEGDYDLSAESFQVRVPESYKPGDGGWGLLVWVSPSGSGRVPRKDWPDVLDKHKLIWIAADNSGNQRALWCRVGLAVDAAENLEKQYTIDPKRVYVAGMSGGSKIANLLGLAYPDVFTGGMYCCGPAFYRDIEAPPQPGEHLGAGQRRVYPRACYPPPIKLLTLTKQQSRHVLLTGENDMNREPTRAIYEKGFKTDGYKHVICIEVPGMGHQIPSAEWFEKAIEFLDDPKPEQAR